MAEKRRGLGRGLGALIPTEEPSDGGLPRKSAVDVFLPDGTTGWSNGATGDGTVSRETGAAV